MRRQYIFIRTRKERSPMSEWVVICLTIIMICPRILHEAGYLAEIISKHRKRRR